jgi:hypothetical protein
MMDSFRLSKWYLDCVSEEGRVFIGYAAALSWGPLRLKYMSSIDCGTGGEVREESTLRGHSEPAVRDGAVLWAAPRLGVEARWAARGAPIARQLLAFEEGGIDWTCHSPLSAASVRIAGRPPVEGLGYVERLDITVKPWLLPIDELRWGRFLSERSFVVWIEWRGLKPLNVVIHDGAAVDGAIISDAGLHFGDFDLELEDSHVIREGTLGSTALRGLRVLRPLLPRKVLNSSERKWRSRGSLLREGRIVSRGWAIHEVMRWS